MPKVTKKITKKFISAPTDIAEKPKVEKPLLAETKVGLKPKRVCIFCQSKTLPSYTDTANLKRFLSDRAKIVSRLRSGVCSKHQRKLSKQIKYARHLSLLPFTPKV